MSAFDVLKDERFGPIPVCWPSKKRLADYLPRSFHAGVVSAYMRIYREKNYREANLSLNKLNWEIVEPKALRAGDFDLRQDDQAVCDWARAKAATITMRRAASGYEKADEKALELCELYGLEPVETVICQMFGDDLNLLERVARYEDEKWWRRKMRRKKAQVIDQLARELRLVHQHNQIYLSDEAYQIRRGVKKKNRGMLENMQAENQHGDTYTLAELSDLSVSKPEIRRHELMVRMKGFEWVAETNNHVGEFVTLTCPSKYHPSSGKRPNPKYQGFTPKEANDYLTYQVWAGVRRDLQAAELPVYGFRVVEPHHDGCPHWHLMLFMRPEHRHQIRAIIRKRAMKVDPGEPGASVHRCKFVKIDPAKGTAAGYIAKYISKNIDGEGVDSDLYGKDAKTSAQRITEWAGTWAIRQFQQVGGPSVTVWRELRRLSEDGLDDWDLTLEAVGQRKIPKRVRWARMAADAANWGAYVMLQGGPLMSFRDRPIRLQMMGEPVTEPTEKVNRLTGEEVTEKHGKYGQFLAKVRGLRSEGVIIISRIYRWSIKPVKQVLGVGGLSGAQAPPWTWTCVNNCPVGEAG